MSQAKPFMKWVGGKTQLLPELFKLFPKTCRNYVEPFLGGGAVFFALASSPDHSFEKAFLNDFNKELVNAYRRVRDTPNLLGGILDLWKEEYLERPEEFYYLVRDMDPKTMTPLDRAARTIFLNKCGFNGLYRVNRAGKFNVPFGKHKNPTIYAYDVFEACSVALNRATLLDGDFEDVCPLAQEGDLVYFDPPYVPLNPTSNFTSYTSDGFTENDQRRLAAVFKSMADKGVQAFLSNSDTPFIRELYKDFEIVTVSARRAVNSKGSARGPVNEVVVTARPSAA